MIAIGLIIAGVIIECAVFVSLFLAWYKAAKNSDYYIAFIDVVRTVNRQGYYVTAQLIGGLAILVGLVWGIILLIQMFV